MLKIKTSYNGYWISDNWLYLDTVEFTAPKISFRDVNRSICIYKKYETEWKGNSAFFEDKCSRFWLENEKAMVEVCIFEREKETEITVHKILTEKYDVANEIIIDLTIIDDLYKEILKELKENIEGLVEKVSDGNE